MKFQCYCCGEEVNGSLALVAMSESSVDRVFVMKPEHTAFADAVKFIIVSEITKEGT